jgi:uncharacterized membrane protein YcaP (DUF421 family)
MKKYEIHLDDIQRILFGQAPPLFLLEVLVRAMVVYVLLLFVARWLGKRMSGQLTVMELAVMLTLGAIVSVPMQTPDRGILQGLLLLLCAVFFQRGFSYLGFFSHKIENILHGKPTLLVKDGQIEIEQMRKDRISRQVLFAELRQKNIFNLGKVDRVYLEASGIFSIFPSEEDKPGLPVFPPDDNRMIDPSLSKTIAAEDLQVCISCGKVKPLNENSPCENCGAETFINAIKQYPS